MTRAAEDRTLRSELSEARFAIQRQLELLRAPPLRAGPPGAREIMTRLRRQLTEIEEALANLDG